MNLEKAKKRDNKIKKRRYGHRRDGDSVKLIQRILQKKRDLVIKKKRDDHHRRDN